MTDRISRKPKRLGKFEASGSSRPSFSREAPNRVSDPLGQLAEDYSSEAARAEVLDYIDQMVELADEILKTAVDGEIDRGTDDGWLTDETALIRGLAADSTRGFALRIMLSAGSISNRIMGVEPVGPEQFPFLARDLLRIAALHNALRSEWVDGPAVTDSVKAQLHRASGGRQKAEANKLTIRRRHRAWQREAIKAWRANSKMTKSAVARHLARKFANQPELSATATTIRAVITKPDDLLCTPAEE